MRTNIRSQVEDDDVDDVDHKSRARIPNGARAQASKRAVDGRVGFLSIFCFSVFSDLPMFFSALRRAALEDSSDSQYML